jgi:hypothetical protein
MPGLVPGIHVLGKAKKDVDGRVKPGHDERSLTRAGVYRFHALANCEISAFSGSLIADGVREKRGAGAGCVTP